MQYFVHLKYLGRRAESCHEFGSWGEAINFSLSQIDRYDISIFYGDDDSRKEVVSFRNVK
jgi:hypothetical protein